MTDFTDEQIERYSRHIILPEVGGVGQRKMLDARVLMIGAGGLGSPAAYYLAHHGQNAHPQHLPQTRCQQTHTGCR